METVIMIPGKKQAYYQIEVDRKGIQERIKEIEKPENRGQKFLEQFIVKDRTMPAKEFSNYGASLILEEYVSNNMDLVDGFEGFFERAKSYAKEHDVDYVLIQNLGVSYVNYPFKISGIVQLLI